MLQCLNGPLRLWLTFQRLWTLKSKKTFKKLQIFKNLKPKTIWGNSIFAARWNSVTNFDNMTTLRHSGVALWSETSKIKVTGTDDRSLLSACLIERGMSVERSTGVKQSILNGCARTSFIPAKNNTVIHHPQGCICRIPIRGSTFCDGRRKWGNPMGIPFPRWHRGNGNNCRATYERGNGNGAWLRLVVTEKSEWGIVARGSRNEFMVTERIGNSK